jgi:hypothetical protein
MIELTGGGFFDLLNPDPAAVRASDIAAALSKLCRYTGHTTEFYSVAEHCVLVHDLLWSEGYRGSILPAALLHDAAEAYCTDISAPLKFALRAVECGSNYETADNAAWFVSPEFRGTYSRISDGIEAAIAERYDLSVEQLDDPIIKHADLWALRIEATKLLPSGGSHWRYPGDVPSHLPPTVSWGGGRRPEVAETIWLSRFAQAVRGESER